MSVHKAGYFGNKACICFRFVPKLCAKRWEILPFYAIFNQCYIQSVTQEGRILASMTAEQAAEAGKNLDFNKVWAALLKTDEQIEKMSKRVDKTSEIAAKTSEIVAKTSEEVAKTSEEVAQLSKRVDKTSEVVAKTSADIAKITKNLGGIGNSIGKMTEAMFSAELWKKFSVHGFKFTKGSNIKFSVGHTVLAEVDFFMENGEYAMPVEIKTELSIEDVDDHLKRMEKIRQYMDSHKDNRKLVGAVAGAVVSKNVLTYAQKKGFFVLVQTGDSIAIAKMSKDFKLKEW
jgi:hypothetical protein